MSTQGKVQLGQGIALELSGVISNLATNEAEVALWKRSQRQDYLEVVELVCQRLSVSEGLVVDGESITLADGVVTARNLVQTDMLIANSGQIGAATITPEKVSLPDGELSALSANLGTMTAGTLIVYGGGITITSDPAGGEPSSDGLIISASQLRLRNSGTDIFTLDGTTGSFDIRSAATGARVQIDGDGVEVYDSINEIGTELSASGLALYNQSEDLANPEERIDFYHGTKADDVLVGSLHGYVQTSTGRELLRWTKDLKVDGNVYATNLNPAWTNFDSTVAGLGNMVLSNVTKVFARYCDVGPVRIFEVAYNYTVDPGTLSYHISFTVPDTTVSQGASCTGYMNIDGTGAKQAYGYFAGSYFDMRQYANAAFTAGTGRSLRAYGWYTRV